MSDTLRSKAIRVAASLPKGSAGRKALLDVLASDRAARNPADVLRAELEKHIRGLGKVLDIRADDIIRGGGWLAVFDTECAALKAHYVYRGSPGLRLGKSNNPRGWYVAVD
jgi:hypothetical protein